MRPNVRAQADPNDGCLARGSDGRQEEPCGVGAQNLGLAALARGQATGWWTPLRCPCWTPALLQLSWVIEELLLNHQLSFPTLVRQLFKAHGLALLVFNLEDPAQDGEGP